MNRTVRFACSNLEVSSRKGPSMRKAALLMAATLAVSGFGLVGCNNPDKDNGQSDSGWNRSNSSSGSSGSMGSSGSSGTYGRSGSGMSGSGSYGGTSGGTS